MRNQRGSFIPLPPKSPSARSMKKTTSTQTEKLVLVKEETLSLPSASRLVQDEGGMKRDYIKAVNYINSCHKFFNAAIEKASPDKKNVFVLPPATNYLPLLPLLMVTTKPKEKKPSKQTAERKTKSNFAVKKTEEAPIDPNPVGDGGKTIPDEKYVSHVTDIVKGQIQSFLTNLQQGMQKAMRKPQEEEEEEEVVPSKCRNLEVIQEHQRVEELTQICFLQKNYENHLQIVTTPPTPPPLPSTIAEINSRIPSDVEIEEHRVFEDHSSECSEIKSDSEINI